ncbi:hypothetical protein PS914_04179 [Pseudomonas fluorescens]|uniref:lipopolysaccharide biosynthesis protein n=1 Tax=Pseudomonas fluorescens TaxID=294 RepID=UPI00123FD92E|nr:oligosaccharide flippase family protein [Pseudomonas fluorescens]VVQ02176.1 hypothetical protein PS914_04179 [Pseudomonas fluorescens]
MITKLLSYAPFQLISALSVFAVLALQARHLEVEQYGVLALIIASAEIVRLFTGQWINSTFIRFYPQAHIAEKKEIQDFCFGYTLILLAPALFVFALLKFIYDPFSEVSTVTVFLFFTSKTLFLYFHQVIRLMEKTKTYQIAASIQAATATVFTWMAMAYSPSIESALTAMTVSHVLGLAFLSPRGKLRLNILSIKKSSTYFKYGIPLAVTGLIFGLSTRADKFIISELMDSHAVGVYSAISALVAGVMSLSFTLIALPLYPEVIKSANDPIKLKKAHAQYFAILITLTLPILLGICFTSTTATQLLLGQKYTDENNLPFYFIAIATYITNLRGHYFDHGLQFTLKTNLTPYIAAFGLFTSIPISYLCIKPLGLIGASIAASITALIALLATWHLARLNNYEFKILPDIKLVLLCNAGLAGIILTTNNIMNLESYHIQIALISLTSIPLYLTLLLIFNPFNFRALISKFITKPI